MCNEIEKHRSRLRSAYPHRVAPQAGYQVAHWCAIDERSGFQSKIYHRGWELCTSIFILRNHHCGLLSTHIFRPCPMNNCCCQRWSQQSERLEILWCTRPVPKLLPVKNNWWTIQIITSIWVNNDILSSTTIERYVSSNRSSLTWSKSQSQSANETGNHRKQLDMPYLPTLLEWYISVVLTVNIEQGRQYHKSDRGALIIIQDIQLLVCLDRFWVIDPCPIDTQMSYVM